MTLFQFFTILKKVHGWTVLFSETFFEDFVPGMIEYLRENLLPPKAILFIDNGPVLLRVEELISGDINIVSHLK